MLRRIILPLALVPIAALASCAATSPHDSPAALSPHHASITASDPYLQALVGDWHIHRTFADKVVANEMDVRPVLEGSFIQLHMISPDPNDPYEAIVLVGFDADAAEYVAHWCDSFGPAYSTVGRGKRVANTVEFRFEYPSGPFFNTWVHDPAADSWTFTGESQRPDATRSFFAKDLVTRRPHRDK